LINEYILSPSLDEDRKKILDWLSPMNYAELQSDIFHNRQQGTGEWFLKSPPFIEWLEGKKKTLFCPGIPGAGKTMIASIAVNHLKTSFADAGRQDGQSLSILYLQETGQSAS
jgi:hypothetical protein